jgi:hypothetical protein
MLGQVRIIMIPETFIKQISAVGATQPAVWTKCAVTVRSLYTRMKEAHDPVSRASAVGVCNASLSGALSGYCKTALSALMTVNGGGVELQYLETFTRKR